jgi:MalT-like TPR region
VHSATREVYERTQLQVVQTIMRIEALLRHSGREEALLVLPIAEVTLLDRRIRLLRALIESRRLLAQGDKQRMGLLAQEAEQVAEGEAEMSWKLIALSITFWLVESMQRQGALLIPRLLAEKERAIAAEDQVTTVRVMRLLTFAYLRAGWLHLLHDEAQAALALMQPSGTHTMAAGYLHYYLAGVYYSWNRLDEAVGEMQQVLHIAATWQHADMLVAGNTALIGFALANAQLGAAEEALQRVEALLAQEPVMNATHAGAVMIERVGYSRQPAPGRRGRSSSQRVGSRIAMRPSCPSSASIWRRGAMPRLSLGWIAFALCWIDRAIQSPRSCIWRCAWWRYRVMVNMNKPTARQ